MKLKFLCLPGICIIHLILFSCNRDKAPTSESIKKLNESETQKYQDMGREVLLYHEHAKKCKTEFEVESFIDSLPYMREAKVREFGGEENWKQELEWLKIHGAKEVYISPNGIPCFKKTEKSQWESLARQHNNLPG